MCLVIGGDWNCTTVFTFDRNGEEPYSQSSVTLSKNMHELTDVWRTRNIGVRQYTWLRVCDDRICGARLDRFYLKKTWNNKVMEVCISPNGFSDHHTVILVKKTLKCNYYWHLNIKLIFI